MISTNRLRLLLGIIIALQSTRETSAGQNVTESDEVLARQSSQPTRVAALQSTALLAQRDSTLTLHSLRFKLMLSGDVEPHPGPVDCDLCGQVLAGRGQLTQHRGKSKCVRRCKSNGSSSIGSSTTTTDATGDGEPSTTHPSAAATPAMDPPHCRSYPCQQTGCTFVGRSGSGRALHMRAQHPSAEFAQLDPNRPRDADETEEDRAARLVEERRASLLQKYLPALSRIHAEYRRTHTLDQAALDSAYDGFVNELKSYQPSFYKSKKRRKKKRKQVSSEEQAVRRAEFQRKEAQYLFVHDQRKLIRRIFDDESDSASFSANELYQYFTDVYAQPNQRVASDRDMPERLSGIASGVANAIGAAVSRVASATLLAPAAATRSITPSDVLAAQRGMSLHSAPGLDGLRMRTLKAYDPEGLVQSALLSICFDAKVLPTSLKRNRTVTLPKKGKDAQRLTNRRPLTLSNMVRRVYARIVKVRLARHIDFHECQKGFLPGDGLAENIFLARSALADAKSSGNELWVIFLDLTKAFDRVGHAHLLAALRRKGVPVELVDVVASLYADSTTSAQHGGQSTKPIPIRRGIAQGCAASPLLFIAAIDFIAHRLHERFSNDGYVIDAEHDRTLLALLFADDLTLFARNRQAAERLVNAANELYDSIGLSINESKSNFFSLNAAADDVALFTERFNMNALDESDLTTYLGAEVGPVEQSRYDALRAKIGHRCSRLLAYPHLLARQKLHIGQSTIGSLLVYPSQVDFEFFIELGKPIIGACRAIKSLYRTILGVNIGGVPDGLLFCRKPLGYLGLGQPEWRVSINGAITARRIETSPDWRVAALAERRGIDFDMIRRKHVEAIGRDSTASSGLIDEPTHTSLTTIFKDLLFNKAQRAADLLRARLHEKLIGMPSGLMAGATLAIERPDSLSWSRASRVGDAELSFGLRSLVGAIPLLTRHVAAKEREKRGSDLCRVCNAAPESMAHVLGGSCTFEPMQRLVSARHNLVQDALVGELRRKGINEEHGWSISIDSPIRCVADDGSTPQIGDYHRRPDIVLQNKAASVCYVLDVTVTFAHSDAHLVERAEEKQRRYAPVCDFFRGNASAQPAATFNTVISEGLVFGARGFIPTRTASFLSHHFKVDKFIWRNISVQLLKSTRAVYNCFMSEAHRLHP